jgi:hypothetical protein
VGEKRYQHTTHPTTPKRCGMMTTATPPAWNVFTQIFAEHWDGCKRVYPRYDRRYYDGLVQKMLGCGDPAQMGSIEYRCLRCGESTHHVSMRSMSRILCCARSGRASSDDAPTDGEDGETRRLVDVCSTRYREGCVTNLPRFSADRNYPQSWGTRPRPGKTAMK